jgi:hypothetical protein
MTITTEKTLRPSAKVGMQIANSRATMRKTSNRIASAKIPTLAIAPHVKAGIN